MPANCGGMTQIYVSMRALRVIAPAVEADGTINRIMPNCNEQVPLTSSIQMVSAVFVKYHRHAYEKADRRAV